jgi:LAO/AO transport system kinase
MIADVDDRARPEGGTGSLLRATAGQGAAGMGDRGAAQGSAAGESEWERMAERVEELLGRVRAGEVRALGRAISLVEDGGPGAEELLAACAAYRGRALRVGITGAPGVGKSTLVDQLARELGRQGRSVAVLAVDPSSPFTGGALLGDRIRMQGGDAGLFIRSMASRGERGGLAAAAAEVCRVLEAAGREVVLLETMGVGQDEIEVTRLADVTVLVLVPGMGDAVQSLKAGIMEAADIYVVNKSDRGGAEQVEAELLAIQGLVSGFVSGREGNWVASIVRTNALGGEGVTELLAAIERCVGDAGRPSARESGLRKNKNKCGGLSTAQRTMELSAASVERTSPFERTSLFSCREGEGSEEVEGRSRSPAGMTTKTGMTSKESGLWLDQESGLRLDHLGIAVRSVAAARGFYEVLGMRVAGEETVAAEQVRTAMLPLGETRLELLEATAEDSVVGRFLERHGEGLHHIALRCADIDGLFARLRERGVRLASERIGVGAGGHRYFFIHPASAGGVLVEIVCR